MLENDLRVRFNLVYVRANPSIWVSEVKKQAHVDAAEKDHLELLMLPVEIQCPRGLKWLIL